EDPNRDRERGFNYLTYALVSSKAHRKGCRASCGGFSYRLPIPSFICNVLNYFKVHISCFNPFGVVKLTTFLIMCRAYGGEPTVKLLCFFLNLGRAGDWLTFSNRGLKTSWKHSPKELVIYYRGQEMDFKSFMMQEINDVANSDDASAGDNENPLVGTSLPPLPEAASCDAIWAKELEKGKAYAELERKCNEALLDLDKNSLVADMRTEIEILQGRFDGLHSECTRLVLEEKKMD
nr:hypothetical protein [Tanacetum cinerariifolium]